MTDTDNRKTGWKVEGNHVFPVSDFREHLPVHCWCRPTEDEGVVIHNSIDRREMYEQGALKPS